MKVKLVCQGTKINKSRLAFQQLKSFEQLVDCLRGMCVSVGNVIELAHFKVAKLKGIRLCVILSCVADDRSVHLSGKVRITRTTEIKIVEIQSFDAYTSLVRVNRNQETVVGGLDTERKILKKLVLHRNCQSPAVLIKGPPGCGKTSLVQQVAADCEAALLTVNSNQLLSSDPEINETKLASFFQKAEELSSELPCILFFDQLEGLDSKSEKQSSASLVNAVLVSHLKRISGVPYGQGLLVILATNQPNVVGTGLLKHDILVKEVSITLCLCFCLVCNCIYICSL